MVAPQAWCRTLAAQDMHRLRPAEGRPPGGRVVDPRQSAGVYDLQASRSGPVEDVLRPQVHQYEAGPQGNAAPG